MNQILSFIVGLLQSALSLLGFVQAHPEFPPAAQQQVQQVAQQAITQEPQALASDLMMQGWLEGTRDKLVLAEVSADFSGKSGRKFALVLTDKSTCDYDGAPPFSCNDRSIKWGYGDTVRVYGKINGNTIEVTRIDILSKGFESHQTSTAAPAASQWKTYTNTQNGYSFAYPSTWKISGSADILDVALPSDATVGLQIQSEKIKAGTTLSSFVPAVDERSGSPIVAVSTTVNTYPAQKTNEIGDGVYYLVNEMVGYRIIVSTNHSINNPTDSSNKETIQKILNSFTLQANTSILQPPSSISVPGMTKYTDTDFGFSFWYPSGWVVKPISVATPTTYKDGMVIKSIEIGSGEIFADNIPNYAEVTIDEFTSPSRSITFNAYDSAKWGPVNGIKYYFDADAHTWMKESPLSSGVVSASDVSKNTMGGLHIFEGNQATFGPGVVPLSAHNFLVVSTRTPVDSFDWRRLMQTITATDPSVATPLSAAEQIKTIQAEKDAYVR